MFNKAFNRYLFALLLTMLSLAANAQDPVVTIKTNAYANDGATNAVSIKIGVNVEGQYIDVDCGFGKVEYELELSQYNDSTQTVGGTYFMCHVSRAGEIKIYSDNPAAIDYFNADGCAITEIDLAGLPNLEILSLNHNELASLDLTPLTKLSAIYLSDNEFLEQSPLVIGTPKPNLTILDVSQIKYMDSSFNLSDYPAMVSFDAFHNDAITSIDPTGCPDIRRISLDVTNVKSIDVTKNPLLQVLNVSETGITSLDLSKNPLLQQLYCTHESHTYNVDAKFKSIDLSNNANLQHFFISGNDITELDTHNNPYLVSLYANNCRISKIDLSNNPNLSLVHLRQNHLDFATLPLDPGTWYEYEYEQRPLEIDRSFAAGMKLDLSNRVNRDDFIAHCTLYIVDEENPKSYTAIDKSYYDYDNGVVTFNKEYSDSLVLAFSNDAFPNTTLFTTRFVVKSTDDYGKNNKLLSFRPSAYSGEVSFSVGVAGATVESPKEVLINFGDGSLQSYTISQANVTTIPNITGTRNGFAPIEIYAADGVELTAFAADGFKIASFDCSASHSLHTLRLTNTQLPSINLENNRCLKELDLSGNNLTKFSIKGKSQFYGKHFLSHLNLSNNAITEIEYDNLDMLHHVNFSHNALTEFNFADCDNVESLNISHNQFSSLSFLHCEHLKSLDFSNNNVSSIILPETNNIEQMDIRNNAFTLRNLPARGAALTEENYHYAPQASLIIATKGPCADLSSQLRTLDGHTTTFAWIDSNGNTLVENSDYTIFKGLTQFINTNVGKVYCTMTHAAFPDFAGDIAYCTTPIEVAGMPTNLVASFETTTAGENVSLSLASDVDSGVALYIDWNGDGMVSQYLLGSTYRLFSATTAGKRTVKAYTYDPSEHITVFSMDGATLSSFDGSGLVDCYSFDVSGAGLSSITLPSSGKIKELMLDNNKFTSFDISSLQELYMLSINNNNLTTLDLSNNPGLGLASAANNKLTSIKLNNPTLWQLNLDGNKFTQLNVDGAPNISQLSLAGNQLSSFNADNLSSLIALAIDHNCMRMSTLPPVKSQYVRYHYHDQQPILVSPDGANVDLSTEAVIDGTPTQYYWFIDMPYLNEEGYLEGELLEETTEYTINNGVTTFVDKIDNVVCVMLNDKFPSLLQYTNLMDITVAGIDGVATSGDIAVVASPGMLTVTAPAQYPVKVFSLNGALAATSIAVPNEPTTITIPQGTYIVTVGPKAFKVTVK